DFKHTHWKSSDSAAAPATLAARSLYFQPAAASSTAKTVGDLGHWNNCFIARDDGFSENTRDLGAGGKALGQLLQQSQTAHKRLLTQNSLLRHTFYGTHALPSPA